MVISPQPLTDLLPLYKTNRDEITTQYDMKGLERLGLLKMDFLGLTTLTVLTDAVKLVERQPRRSTRSRTLPLDDADTLTNCFSRGDTTAIFQFESHGMRDILRRYQPTRLEDLDRAQRALPPGPHSGRHGRRLHRAQTRQRRKSAYDLPELKEILEETYGVILYQEQVMQIANRLAGFSLGEADILRRAMGKKKREEMAAQREKFLAGASAHKVPAKKAEQSST